MKYFRAFFYVLLVVGFMLISYFITEFILDYMGVTLFSLTWFTAMVVVIILVGVTVSLLAPYLVTWFLWVINEFTLSVSTKSTKELISGTIGLIAGLTIAALISIPLKTLPLGGFISVFLIIFFGYAGLQVGMRKNEDVGKILRMAPPAADRKQVRVAKKAYLGILDTSAIIDGRFADVYRTGFLEGSFILPTFVLDELKRVADASDPLKKERGRRGLNILNELKEEHKDAYTMVNKDYEDIREVDTKIIRLAVDMKTRIFTNDYNLNRMAKVQNVTVLNINDLANALKSVVLPGEELIAHVIREGKEANQGVAYLDDGTMIVVEDGKKYVGLTLQVEVTSALQTANGKMIFAKPKV